MSYDITIIKDILLKLKDIDETQTISLENFKEHEHKDISENIRQLGKEDFISGTVYTKEKTDSGAYDFNIHGLKSSLRGLQLLELLQKDNVMSYFLKHSIRNPQPTINQLIVELKEYQIKVGIL